MSNVRFAWRFNSDAATVTAATVTTGYPVARVLSDQLATRYQTAATQALERIVFDMGSAVDINFFAAFNHDITSGDSLLKIEANTSDSWGSPAFSEAVDFNAGKLVHYLSAAESYRFWSFTFTKSASGETRHLGRVVFGTYTEVEDNASIDGTEWGFIDLSEVVRTKGGQVYANQNEILRTLSLVFPFAALTQMEEFQTLAETFGVSRAFFVSLDHDSKPYDWLLYGTMDDDSGSFKLDSWTGDADATRWRIVLNMTEAK